MKVSISGVRGIYGSDLSLSEVSRFSMLFASVIKSGKCVVARDTRPSGRVIAQVVSSSLMSRGIDVYNLGVAPTPMAFREARRYGAAVMVTASHNPLEWNGLKFVIEGRGLFEQELQAMLNGNNTDVVSEKKFGSEHAIDSGYIGEVVDMVSQSLPKDDLSVRCAIDPGGGAACGYAYDMFKRLGLGKQTFTVNDIRGVSSRGPDPTADELQDLSALVKSNNLDYGFALDLDSDRLVVVMGSNIDTSQPENQSAVEKLNPDATLLLCVARSLEMGIKKFVTSIDTSVAIGKFVKENGGSIGYSKVGEANVVNKMLEVSAEAGGEGSSAGFIMPKFNMCRDGFLASAIIATLDKKVIKRCLDFASKYVQIRSKIPMDSSLHSRVIEGLPDIMKSEASEVITIDGVKAIVDEDSWVLVRPSNTEHAIRVSVESRAPDAQKFYNKMSEKVIDVYEKVR